MRPAKWAAIVAGKVFGAGVSKGSSLRGYGSFEKRSRPRLGTKIDRPAFGLRLKFIGLPGIWPRRSPVVIDLLPDGHPRSAKPAELAFIGIRFAAILTLDHKLSYAEPPAEVPLHPLPTKLKADAFAASDGSIHRFDQFDRPETIFGSHQRFAAREDRIDERPVLLNVAPTLFFLRHMK